MQNGVECWPYYTTERDVTRVNKKQKEKRKKTGQKTVNQEKRRYEKVSTNFIQLLSRKRERKTFFFS